MSTAPKAKYHLTLKIRGNSHEEIEDELLALSNGGYLLDSEHHKRNSFRVIGGRVTSELEHVNPDMTPERYKTELSAWFPTRKGQA